MGCVSTWFRSGSNALASSSASWLIFQAPKLFGIPGEGLKLWGTDSHKNECFRHLSPHSEFEWHMPTIYFPTLILGRLRILVTLRHLVLSICTLRMFFSSAFFFRFVEAAAGNQIFVHLILSLPRFWRRVKTRIFVRCKQAFEAIVRFRIWHRRLKFRICRIRWSIANSSRGIVKASWGVIGEKICVVRS